MAFAKALGLVLLSAACLVGASGSGEAPRLTYQCEGTAKIRGIAGAGSISDDAVADPTGAGHTCAWSINAVGGTTQTKGATVSLTFKSMALSGATEGRCEGDAVKVYDDCSADADSLVGSFCGGTVPADVIKSTGGCLYVTFRASSASSKGFMANFDFEGIDANAQKISEQLGTLNAALKSLQATTKPGAALAGKFGRKGAAGPAGAAGDKGLAGEAGDPGSVGEPGGKGAKGEKGEAGSRGLPGKDGADGKKGAKGKAGKKGPAGKSAPAGDAGTVGVGGKSTPGPDGPAGAAGPKGPAGAAGENGARGKRGKQGAMGKPAKDGAPGKPGTNGTAGIAGARGAQGMPGEQGGQGIDGKMGAAGKDGEAGVSGPPGLAGPLGTKGDAGSKGEAGQDFRLVKGKGRGRGPPGPQGVRGKAGMAGPAGGRGSGGDAGHQGKNGKSGSEGLEGDQGSAGPDGGAGAGGKAGAKGGAPCKKDALDTALEKEVDREQAEADKRAKCHSTTKCSFILPEVDMRDVTEEMKAALRDGVARKILSGISGAGAASPDIVVAMGPKPKTGGADDDAPAPKVNAKAGKARPDTAAPEAKPEPEKKCCAQQTAKCQACMNDVTEADFCKQSPKAKGCELFQTPALLLVELAEGAASSRRWPTAERLLRGAGNGVASLLQVGAGAGAGAGEEVAVAVAVAGEPDGDAAVAARGTKVTMKVKAATKEASDALVKQCEAMKADPTSLVGYVKQLAGFAMITKASGLVPIIDACPTTPEAAAAKAVEDAEEGKPCAAAALSA